MKIKSPSAIEGLNIGLSHPMGVKYDKKLYK